MSNQNPVKWQTYEEVARYLLDMFATDFGVDCFEGKQDLRGNCGTEWEIDAKGVRQSDGAIVLVECRRHTTSKLSQEAIAAFAWRIDDLNAMMGIIVSPFDLQKGAKLVAAAGNIVRVRLDPTSTVESFRMEFIDKLKAVAGMGMFISGC